MSREMTIMLLVWIGSVVSMGLVLFLMRNLPRIRGHQPTDSAPPKTGPPNRGSYAKSLLPVTRPLPCPPMKSPRPEIVCLCGSTRFMEAFHAAGWELTLQGKIVLTVGVCKHAADHGGEALGQDVADKLDELHRRKIDLSDWVFVLNVEGYIGDSTADEIEYAENAYKPVYYLETGHTPDSPKMKLLIDKINAAMYEEWKK